MSQSSIDQQLSDLSSAVRLGIRAKAQELVGSLLEHGAAPDRVVDAMVRAMDEIGHSFQCQEIFIPQMLIAARAMNESMALLEPALLAAGGKPRYRAVIGTVAGDVHDIGKNLVAMMWKGAGFDVLDLGTNVPASTFLEVAEAERPDLIGLSALLTTTMPAIKTTVEVLAPVRTRGVRVIVGGAPLTQSFADQIGADGYAPDAARAVDTARRLVGAERQSGTT
jgi:5-methyltetrahydrofolate--homocysteine methyltransferase